MSDRADGPLARLVVVEDDDSIRELLAAGLRFAHYDVRTVADGGAALTVLAERTADLVVLDRRETPGLVVRSFFFLNKGDGTFEPKPTTFSGLDASGIAGEAADLNNDGLLDLVIAADPDNTGGATDIRRYESKVYWNTGAHGARENHWLRLRFSGVKDAELIGARVELTAMGEKQYRWIHSNHSYKSGGALEAHFGLGKATVADVKVTLLNGKTVTFTGLKADQFVDLNLNFAQVTPLRKETRS